MKFLKYIFLLLILLVLSFVLYTYLTPPASPKGESSYTLNNKSISNFQSNKYENKFQKYI